MTLMTKIILYDFFNSIVFWHCLMMNRIDFHEYVLYRTMHYSLQKLSLNKTTMRNKSNQYDNERCRAHLDQHLPGSYNQFFKKNLHEEELHDISQIVD